VCPDVAVKAYDVWVGKEPTKYGVDPIVHVNRFQRLLNHQDDTVLPHYEQFYTSLLCNELQQFLSEDSFSCVCAHQFPIRHAILTPAQSAGSLSYLDSEHQAEQLIKPCKWSTRRSSAAKFSTASSSVKQSTIPSVKQSTISSVIQSKSVSSTENVNFPDFFCTTVDRNGIPITPLLAADFKLEKKYGQARRQSFGYLLHVFHYFKSTRPIIVIPRYQVCNCVLQ